MYANANKSPALGQEVFVSINERVTPWGVTYNSLCCQVPRQWEKKIKEYLHSKTPYRLEIKDKGKLLIPIFINNVTQGVAAQLKEELKSFLKELGLPFREHGGRSKDEMNGTYTNHESPLGGKNVGYVGDIRPWKVSHKEIVRLNNIIIKDLPKDDRVTIGEQVEERLLEALSLLKDRGVEAMLSAKGSKLDMMGKDLIISKGNTIWAFQIKCAELDAHLNLQKYPQEICLWVNPGSTDEEISSLVEILKKETWGYLAPQKARTVERPKLKQQ
jgi:hypothetical protein